MSDYVDGLVSSQTRNMHGNIKLQPGEGVFHIGRCEQEGRFFFFFLSADVCYHDLKMIYGKSSAEASWSSTNLKRPRRWGHYLPAVSSSSSFPKITAVNFPFHPFVLKRHQRFLSFLSSFPAFAWWRFGVL